MPTLNTIEEAIEDIKKGNVVIIVDDDDRENEGDFVCAAEKITPEIINFMSLHGRGLICTPITLEKANNIDLPMMVRSNTSLHETAFTVSIDLQGNGVTTGISANDRYLTIKQLSSPNAQPKDFARPGHVFPLIAKPGGVLRRTGHTEASVDLAILAGLQPVGVLVEILNEDGSMARLNNLWAIKDRFNLKIISIKDLVSYRLKSENIVKLKEKKVVDTIFGQFEVCSFIDMTNQDIHYALIKGDISREVVPVRVQAINGIERDLGPFFLKSQKIEEAISDIESIGCGVLLFMRHREDEHFTIQKSSSEIQKDYGVGAQILRLLGLKKIKLLTKTHKNFVALGGYDLEFIN